MTLLSSGTKKFLHSAMVLIIPVALQNLITTGINSIDVIMLGRVGENVLSGASLGNQIHFIMMLFLFGTTSGASVLIAQYWGKKDMQSIAVIFGIAMKTGVVIGISFAGAAFFIPRQLMCIFTDDEDIIVQGIKYLRVVCFAYPLTGINMIYLNTMRSMEKVKVATAAYLTAFFTNIFVNLILIFGLFGFPAMGAAGAAIGTIVARFAEFCVVVVYNRKYNNVLRFKLNYLFVRDTYLSRDFWKYSLPVVLNELFWGFGLSAIAAILGHLGGAVVAANAVAQVARQLSMVVAFGVGSAAAVEIGKKIGAGDITGARDYGRRYALLSLAAGFLGAAVILGVRPVVLYFMVITDVARSYLSLMMYVMSYFVIGQALNSTFIVGIFRAGGDTRFGLYFDLIFMWGIAIVGGALAAFVFHAPVMVVYVILLSDEILKIPAAYVRYRSYKWLCNITR